MINYCNLFASLIFLLLPLFSQPMDDRPSAPTNTLLWLSDNSIIVSSRNACYIKNPFSKAATVKLHNELAHNIILNKDKTKAALFCSNSLVIYDILTKEKIWSLPISYSANYSATFSPSDDIVIFDRSRVTINSKETLNLPFIEHDPSFPITCNYTTKEIMYPSNNKTFSRKCLESNQIRRHPRIWEKDDKKYIVDSAIYNPYSNDIILYTHEKENYNTQYEQLKMPLQEFFLLHPKNHTLTRLTGHHVQEDLFYHTIKILPKSTVVAALCNGNAIHFFDYMQQKEMLLELLNGKNGACKSNKNVLDFNANATYYALITNRNYFRRATPECLLKYIVSKNNICFFYFIVCTFLEQNNLWIPKDIKRLLIQYFHAIYKLDTIR